MISRLPDGGIAMVVRPPLVYLDHWALRRLGENSYERSHFLRTFEKRGTVMFSLMNALEMTSNQRAEDQGLPQPNCFLTDQRLTAILFNNMPASTVRTWGSVTVGCRNSSASS